MTNSYDLTEADVDPRQKPWLKSDEQLPTRESCNPNCPEEAFLWMLIGNPGMRGAPLSWPNSYLRMVSRRMWDCGARPSDCDDDLKASAAPVVKYRAPSSGVVHWTASAGSWHDINDPEPDAPGLKEVLDNLPQADQAAAYKHLESRFDKLRSDLGLPSAAEESATKKPAKRAPRKTPKH